MALQNLASLQVLHLNGNLVKKIASISHLIRLEFLSLVDNPIIDITSLRNLIRLTELFLPETGMSTTDVAILENSLVNCAITFGCTRKIDFLCSNNYYSFAYDYINKN